VVGAGGVVGVLPPVAGPDGPRVLGAEGVAVGALAAARPGAAGATGALGAGLGASFGSIVAGETRAGAGGGVGAAGVGLGAIFVAANGGSDGSCITTGAGMTTLAGAGRGAGAGEGGASTAVAAAPASSLSFAAFFLDGAFLVFTAAASTCSVVSTAVEGEPELHHSRMVASRPADTVDMWSLMVVAGMPSAWHLATMALDSMPSSFARLWMRLVAKPTSESRPQTAETAADKSRHHRQAVPG